MKKKIFAIVLTLISSQVFAEDVQKLIHQLGYTQNYIYDNAPKHDFLLQKEKTHQNTSHKKKPTTLPDDFLKPHVYEKSEEASMIPLLLKLQKQNPTSVKITRKLAPTCLKAGQFREALYWYTQTYIRDRSDVEALWNMASLAHELGMKDKAAKYLEEYAKVDPNSAWGRMAKEFLKGEYSNNLKDGFRNKLSRIGFVSDGASDDTEILVIEGKRTNVETVASEYQPDYPASPIQLKPAKVTTLKGNKKKKLNKKKHKRTHKAGSLKNANIKKATKSDKLTVKGKSLL